MKTFRTLILATSLVALAACGSQSGEDTNAPAIDTETPLPAPTPTAPAVDGIDDGYPDLTPAPVTPEAEKTETGARALLLSWGRAIELREYTQAYRMMGEAGAARWTLEEFRAIFADLDTIAVALPDGTMEGAAGSSYYALDVTIDAQDGEGRPIRIEGPLVLRRVNDVPGASEASLRWHFESIDLAVTH